MSRVLTSVLMNPHMPLVFLAAVVAGVVALLWGRFVRCEHFPVIPN